MTTRCYGIDGTPYATNDRYIPCNATAAQSGGYTSCCAPGDNCLSNGLCQSQPDDKRQANLFWRNGCTDPTWNDPACPKFCSGLDAPDTHGIYYCLQKNSWCCPTGPINTGPTINTTCCSITNLAFSAADPVVYTTAQINFVSTIRTSSTATSAAQSQSTGRTTGSSVSFASSQVTQTSTANTNNTSTNSGGDSKIGIYVGVPLGILLAIALAVIAWLVIKNKKLKQAAAKHELPATAAYVSPHYSHQQDKPTEFPGHAQYPQPGYAYRPNELPDSEVAHEMPGKRLP